MIYLDNAATTKMYDEAIKAYVKAQEETFANPSALHSFGMEAENLIKQSRKYIASVISSAESEIFFTKSASESNNIAIKSFGGVALTSKIEHSSVQEAFKNSDFDKVIYLDNDKYGFIDLNDLKKQLNNDISFVSIIYVNNEIGCIQDIRKISKIIKSFNKNIILHIDATQALGKIDCDVKALGVDMMSFSAHKFHGPKQMGGLYIKKDITAKVKPILDGGYQEIISSGTSDAPSIYAMAIALRKQIEANEYEYIKDINSYFRSLIKDSIDDYYIISPEESCSAYILDVAFANIKAEVLLHMLEEEEIYVSSGSACSKGDDSRILSAIDLDEKYMDGSIRFSFSGEISKEDLDFTIDILKRSIELIRMVI